MKNENALNEYINENQFTVDELGRIVIEDKEVMEQIAGAYGEPDPLATFLSNGACANAACS